MNEILLFTDGSVNPQLKIGYGAYLVVLPDEFEKGIIKQDVQLKKFNNTSSTKLEVQTLLWALKEIEPLRCKVIVFTDCQNILGLKNRRKGFEENDYMTGKNKKIGNHELYKEFYRITDKLDCDFIKVKGHKVKSQKDEIDKLFTLVDKASRNALRTDSSIV